jgi:metallo-beta-lactamase family protein
MPPRTKKAAAPSVTFWGAAQTVTGSMHLLQANGKSILLDCGLYQGKRSEAFSKNRHFPFKPKKIDAVILSHAHVDHCGNLPNLVKQGFTGPIFCTSATRALASVMLGDAAKIQEEDANYLNRNRKPGDPKVEPIYDGKDVYRTLCRLQAIRYGVPKQILNGFEATFVDAGHLLGSAMVHLKFETAEGPHTITFTGDIGRNGLPILRDPSPIPPAQLIISESTYGGHTHEPVDETAERLGEVVRKVIQRGGKVIIPAFAVGRTQNIVYFLHQLMTAGKLPYIPIYVDSPMAVKATEVFRMHSECYDDETMIFLQKDPDLFGDKRVQYVERMHDSIALNYRDDPCIIISASGMCEAGRVLHHLKHNIENPRNAVLIVGYQAPDTLGRRLVDHLPEVRILGRFLRVKAEVVVMNGLSSHADHADFLRLFTPLLEQQPTIRLVHGERERAQKLMDGLTQLGFNNIAIPSPGESVTWPTSPPQTTLHLGD